METPLFDAFGSPGLWDEALGVAGILGGAVLAGVLVHRLLVLVSRRALKRARTDLDETFLHHCSRPLGWGLPVLFVYLVLPLVLPDGAPGVVVERIFLVLVIGFVAWFFVGLTGVMERIILSRFRVDVRDNLRARRVHTQIEIVRKILVLIIGILAFAAILMTFDRLREVGTGILASAGLAGLVIGFAAQRTLGNLVAGFQIAITQPIRLDDVVIVEGEWGWIEEISLTYVVVRIWDLRRLVVPIGYFIEKPFQNWTRTSANILGTVFLHADYTVPVGEVREELFRILDESPHWNGEVRRLHVTEARERTVELRCLMSAQDSPSAWELRCEVREKLLDWIQREHPEALPRIRTELDRVTSGPAASSP